MAHTAELAHLHESDGHVSDEGLTHSRFASVALIRWYPVSLVLGVTLLLTRLSPAFN